MNPIEHLEEYIWETPKDYGSLDDKSDPVGDYCIYSRTRDSSVLVNCNYEVILKELETLDPKVYDFRASHWAVGWIEHIIVPKKCNQKTLKRAGEIICSLANYPVLDEIEYSQMVHDAKNEYWKNLDVSERIKLIKKNNGNIFAARHNYINENADPNESLLDRIC